MEERMELGPCCGCGKVGSDVRNIVMLSVKAPVPGTGWGCLVCGLPPDGAYAVLCDDCLEADNLRQACKGYPKNGERVPVESLDEPFEHDYARHERQEMK